jgi:hypothetical protein
MRAPELDRYFQVKITKPGAQILITQIRTVYSPSSRLLGARFGQLPADVGETKDPAARIWRGDQG